MMSSYRYRDPHVKDKTVARHGNPLPGKDGFYIETGLWWWDQNILGELGHSLWWRHNGGNSVSNPQPHDCLLNRLFKRRAKKTSKLRVTGLCAGNSPGNDKFRAQSASNAENVSIWWRHHVTLDAGALTRARPGHQQPRSWIYRINESYANSLWRNDRKFIYDFPQDNYASKGLTCGTMSYLRSQNGGGVWECLGARWAGQGR